MSFADWSNEKKKKKQEQQQSINTQAVLGDKTSFSDWSDKKAVSRVDYDYVNSFVKSATDFLSTAEKEHSSVGWDNAYNTYRTRVSSYNDLNVKARNISEWLKTNADKIDSDTYNTYNTFLDEYNKSSASVIEAFKSSKDMFSQFESEEAYKTAKRQNDINNMSPDDIKLHIAGGEDIAYTTADGKNVTWQSLYDKKVKEQEAQALYSSIYGKTDFKDAVKAATAYKNPAIKDAERGKAVVNKVTYFEENANMIGMGEANGGGSNIVSFSMSKMTDQEKAIYNYYFGIGAYEQADAYLDSLEDDLQERFETQLIENMTEFAQESPVIASAISVGTNLFSAAEALRDVFDYAASGGETLDRNHSADVTNAIRGAVSEQVDWEIGNFDAFDFLYNTGMSGVDSLTAGYLLGPVAGVSLGLSAAAQGVNDALDRGMSDRQAFFNGFFSGVFEGIFESFSIGKLNALKEVPVDTVKDLAKNVAKSMLTNATEEAATELANIAYDTIINGKFANYTIDELKNGALKDVIFQIAESAASGAVMGAGFGVIGSAAGTANTNAIMKDTYGGSASELVTEALEINPDNKYAQKIQSRLEGGKSATGNQLRKLNYQITMSDVSAIQNAAAERLGKLGETGDVDALAKALAKQVKYQSDYNNVVAQLMAQGKTEAKAKKIASDRIANPMSRSEKQLIEGSKYGQRVANELSPDNIRSGQYSSAWAEKIGTNRINSEEYGRLLAEDENVTDTNVGNKPEQVKQTAQEPAPTSQGFAPEEKTVPTDENTTAAESAAESKFEAPEAVSEEAEADETVTLEAASAKYGAQAGAMVHTYSEGQDVAKYDAAYGRAYDMGKSGVALSYAMDSKSTAYLTESQRELAYEAGKAAAGSAAVEQDNANKAAINGKTGRRIGVVKGEGVSISDLKKSFNDTQNTAYKVLSTYAEATGIDIVLYKSEAGADGRFEGAQGKFKWSEDTIYIDINAGLRIEKEKNILAKYTMLRTFAHEFTHFIEKWNPVQYNEFRRLVFDTLTERGENVNDLIEQKQALTKGMSYDVASREVVAEAMADILPDANFVQELAEKHKTIFDKLLEKLKEFVADLKAYFSSVMDNAPIEAKALKEQIGESVKYVESIVKLFDRVAVEAVENYQRTVAVEQEKISAEPKLDTNPTQSRDTIVDNNTDGGIENAESVDTGRNSNAEEKSSGARKENGDRSRVQSTVGEETQGLREESGTADRGEHRRGELNSQKELYNSEDFVTPEQGTALYDLQKKALDEYGLKLHIIKESAWGREDPAIAFRGEVYVVENIEEDMLSDVIPHEATHAMRHLKFQPYLDFIERTPDMLNFTSKDTYRLIKLIEDHLKKRIPNFDFLNMTPKQHRMFYDELNSSVYGLFKGGAIEDSNYDYGWIPSAFHDFDAYINELVGIHEQFKQQNAPQKAVETDHNDVYASLSKKLNGSYFVKENGLNFGIRGNDKDGYHGFINRKREDTGTYPIENAFDRIYKSDVFKTAKEAIDDIVSVARMSELLKPRDNANKARAANNNKTSSEKLADSLLAGYINEENINRTGKALTSKELYALADEAFGGTQAEGAYNRKDAYDAMELAVNKFLLEHARRAHKSFNGTAESAVSTVEFMQDMLELLPTQNVRTQEMEDFQQFSTPPNIAYLAAWAANINANDFVLEPSAGIGGLAVFAKAWGAEVAVNELSKRRLEVLRAMGFDHLFNENAEQIDNILPDSISPSVVIMNPPFSSTAGRTTKNKTSNAEKHIDQALARLRDGGRLVAVLGKSMNDNDYYSYWDKLRKSFNIRANLSIDGSNYKKYGTTWGVQIVVIDKTGPQTGKTVTGRFTDLTEIPNVLEGIRNDRSRVEENRSASTNDSVSKPVSDGGNKQSDTGHKGVGERSAGGTTDTERKKSRKSSGGDQRTGDRTDGKRLAEESNKEAGSKDGERDRTAGRTDTGDGAGAVEPSISDRQQPELSSSRLSETEESSDDGVYATFIAPDIPIKGGKKHPAVLVESAAMAAVSMPKATYKVKLPEDVIKNNLSDAQLVTVTYAGQAHEQKLPDGRRKGFFVGDGTGVGKGRQIAGIILDNFMQGRTKAVWISKNNDLYGDAIRDWTATTGRSKDEVISHNKVKSKDKISIKEGILYSTYDTLKSEKGGNRLEQIVEWLGEDFDGVIAFDEAHNMGNLFGKKGKFGKSKGSEKARAGVELQRRLPNARIVYVSATAATEVDNLAYAERVGLWGQGTAFTNAQDFISKIGASGLAAMELVIRDMKAMGTYVARSISYNGVNYDTVEHALDPMQTEIYNTMSRAWQKTMSNVQSALETTGGKYNSTERQRALGNFYSGMQRFYNQVLTSMAMPSVIADMRRELDAGHSAVLQIVNTNEAQQNKQLAEAKANGESLDNLDLTPREALLGYLMTSFPTQMFEEYTDDDGNLRSRPVMDSAGNPVQNKEAIRQRDALVAEVNQMSIPDGPLEMLFDAFGPDMVAENTGRSRRVVPKKMADGSITRVEERRTLNHRTADVQAFQDGKKRILVFSDAGGTGKSYHADRTEKNQQLRIHYVLQPGWVASNAVQGFGRTHRSNEASAPIYKLVTTNIKGQKRFTSTIARRLDQLGALTKGQRDTGSGMFGAKDNLETDLAKDSLREFYRRLGKNLIEDVDGMKTLDRLGLKEKFTDEFGAFKINDNLARDISTFLNRILALEVDEQNVVFDAFISIYEMELEAAIQSGNLDTGMENVKADKIEVVDDKVIRQDENTGSETHYIQAKTYTKPKVVTTIDEMSKRRDGFVGVYRTEGGAVRAVFRIADKTTEWGAIQKQFRLVSPNLGAKTSVWNESTLNDKAELIDKAEWQKEWDAEVARVPEYNEDTLHMLTGALLPIWNSLPQEGSTKVKRLIANDGNTYLGRVIDKDLIDTVLNRFSVDRTKEVFTAQQVRDKAINNGVRFYLTNNRAEIFRSRVSGEWRLEITQPYNTWFLKKTYPGLIQERIQYRDRYFIPVGETGTPILKKILQDNPVRSTADDMEQYQSRAYINDGEQYQQRTGGLTDYEVLEYAADKVDLTNLTDGEKDALRIFKERLSKLNQLQDDRAEQGRLYKEQQFGAKPDRAAAAETLNRMHILDSQIQKASADVLSVEDKKVLKTVLQKARKVVEVEERRHGQEILNRWRDRRNNAAAIKKYRDRLRRDVDDLSGWVLNPNNKDIVKHIPDALKNSVVPFLSSINFMSKRSLNGGAATQADEAFMDRLKKLNKALKSNIDLNGLYSGYSDLPPNFMERLQTFIDSTEALVKKNSGELVINLMTSEELKELSQVVRTLKKYIMQFNRFHYNAMYQHVYEAGDSSIEYMSEMKPAGNTGKISEFLLWQQIRPAFAFERFGEGGKSIYDGLRRGQAQLAFNTEKIKEFADKTYTAKEVQAWENELKSFTITGDLVKIPVSNIMAMYLLTKDPEAKVHIDGDGIRVATFTHKGKKISDTGHRLTTAEINRIVNSLTPRQKEVAESLQKFMAEQGGAWGNYVSVARFGEELFTNPNYFPINSDGRHLQANTEEHPSAAALYALLNMSFTKSRKENASNRIVIYSVFDVFANHMASMAQYNAMALPLLDAVKWFNYQQVFIDDEGNKTVVANVREKMAKVYGVPEEKRPGSGNKGYAVSFVENILKAFNGTEAQGIPADEVGMTALHRYNIAQVAFNFRVVIQQPLAITRAALLVDYASILRGLKLSPKAIKNNIKEMREHSGIAAWKALGFYDINISRGLTDIIKHKSTFGDKVSDIGMWGAEKADLMTWAAIWSAAKEEVIRKQKIRPESDLFYDEVTKLFEDIIYKTQVVDSVLTKNEFLRSKGTFARLVGSFMSEPTTTASMLIDAYDKYYTDMQRGMTRQQAWQNNGRYIGRVAYVYGVSAVILAAVQAVADAWRDDDEYEEWYEKWLEAFGGNLVDELIPVNKLPILSDFYDLAKTVLAVFGVDTYGNPPQSVFMQWYDSLVKGVKILHDRITGEDTNYTWYGGIYKMLQAVSGMSGLPMAATTRELVALWNNTVGAMAPSLKVKSYDPGDMSEIKYAYADGYLTFDEAVAQLLDMGLVDNENEAYFTVQGWEAGEGYSRYDAVYDVVRNGGNIREAMAELTSHGYTEEQIISQIKGKIGEWYRGGEITKAQAVTMLQKYADMDSDKITETVNKWSSKVVTGIDYDDIDDEFMAGNITASRAIQMYKLYGGMTQDKAREKVTVLEFVKKHPSMEGISYSAVESYTKYCEPYGVSAQVFYDAWKQKNNLSGDVKESMMRYINSLNLSARQKDSLYYAFGWAESKIYEAPWR